MLIILTFYILIWLKWRLEIRKAKKAAAEEILGGSSPEEEGMNSLSGRPKKKHRRTRAAIRLLMYPLAYIIIWTPGTINHFYENWYQPSFALSLIQTISQSSTGIADALVYLLTLRKTIWRYYGSCKKSVDDTPQIDELSLNYVAMESSRERWLRKRSPSIPGLPSTPSARASKEVIELQLLQQQQQKNEEGRNEQATDGGSNPSSYIPPVNIATLRQY